MTYCETCTNDFSPDDFDGCPHCDLAEGRTPVRAAPRAETPPAAEPVDAEPLFMTPSRAPAEGGALRDVLQSIRRMTAAPAPRPQAPEGLNDSLRALVEQKIEAQAAAAPEPEPVIALAEAAPEAELAEEAPESEAAPAPVLAEAEAEPAKGSIGGHQARELDVETLRKIRESGVFTMVLLGLPTAGKTWFLNRLKYELQEGDAYACYPRRAPPGEVENTLLFTAHRFRKGVHDFYMIDIPGERFQKAVEGSFLGESNALMRHVIFSGHAFLTLLPADETLLSERAYDLMWRQKNGQAAAHGVDLDSLPAPQALIDRVDELKRLIAQARKALAAKGDIKGAGPRLKALLQERKKLLDGGVQQAVHRLAAKNEELGEYISGIGLMAQLMVVMNEKGTPDLDPSIDAYEVFDASRAAERKKPTQPMFVVLSKSDDLTHRSDAVQLPIRRLVQGDGRAAAELRTLLNDPHRADAFAALQALRPGVARQIDEWFAWTSFQFATAFNGVSRGSKEINYQLRHVGVTELIRAILRLKEHTEKRRPWEAIAGLFRRRGSDEAEKAA